MPKKRQVFHTIRYAVRYCDNVTAQQARLHTEASLSMTAVQHGVKVGKVREVRDFDILTHYDVDLTRVY